MNESFSYNFIAIEGNIGAGKTTLCNRLAEDFSTRLILEQFTDNPFLPLFYDQPERYAFPVELFFMTERHKQLQQAFAQTDLFTPLSISDYFFNKTRLFAKNNLNEEEFRLFTRLFEVLNTSFPKPDLMVYLHRSVGNLLENIKKRGRQFETDITATYLENIQNVYFEYFKTENSFPIVVLDCENAEFLDNETDYQSFIRLLKSPFENGLNIVGLRDLGIVNF